MGLEGMLGTGDKTIFIAVIFSAGRNNTCIQYLLWSWSVGKVGLLYLAVGHVGVSDSIGGQFQSAL